MKAKRVVVAMSGGVDSSVAAFLLKKKGFQVIGITMHIWPRERRGQAEKFGGCCGIDGTEDAKKVAGKLGIPHYVLNFRDVFREKVIANFCEEYRMGRTPNPCIRCNQHIKFDCLLKKAKGLGADYIATGHYARIGRHKDGKRFFLKKGIDRRKDQSYFLYVMTQEQLRHTLMPLGNFTKERVRQIAGQLGLSIATKPESQEICFIHDNNYGRFLKESLCEGPKPGPVVDVEGQVLGRHRGIVFYTIGQRKGIGIAARGPLYVVAIDRESNAIVVGKKEHGYGDGLIAGDINIIDGEIKSAIRIKAKIRSLHQASSASVIPLNEDEVQVKFDRPQWAITPGQAVVFYDGEKVLGGGTILCSTNGRTRPKDLAQQFLHRAV